jgi:hypothetical protein
MKKILALLLAALMLLTCAACAAQKPAPTDPTTEPTTQPVDDHPTEPATGERTATYIQLSISEADGSYVSLTAYEDGDVGSKAGFAVLSVRLLRCLKGLYPEMELSELARMYSAEIEYSTENLDILFEELL